MKAIAFAVLVFAMSSATGIAQRTSGDPCNSFNCATEVGGILGEKVNRMAKGDRLPLVPALHRVPAKQPAKIEALRTLPPDQELLDGCEPLASSLSRSPLANVAGWCLS
jgi:hypothetical protein